MEDDERLILTPEQEKAIKSLGQAFKRCTDANVYIHDCYGRLLAYNGHHVKNVSDDIDEFSCDEGHYIEMHGIDISSWADDNHFIHFK